MLGQVAFGWSKAQCLGLNMSKHPLPGCSVGASSGYSCGVAAPCSTDGHGRRLRLRCPTPVSRTFYVHFIGLCYCRKCSPTLCEPVPVYVSPGVALLAWERPPSLLPSWGNAVSPPWEHPFAWLALSCLSFLGRTCVASSGLYCWLWW